MCGRWRGTRRWTHVLEGSIRKDADGCGSLPGLVDAKTGEHVWAERFDRSGTHLGIAGRVTEKICLAALVGDIGTVKRAQYREAWEKDSTSLQEYDAPFAQPRSVDAATPGATERAHETSKEGLSEVPELRPSEA